MWFDEVERIGMRQCTPTGYMLKAVGNLFWAAGLLMLFASPICLAAAVCSLDWSLLWLLTIPFVFGIAGLTIVTLSQLFACRKQFRYDYERRVSSWVEGGENREYSYADWQVEHGRSRD